MYSKPGDADRKFLALGPKILLLRLTKLPPFNTIPKERAILDAENKVILDRRLRGGAAGFHKVVLSLERSTGVDRPVPEDHGQKATLQ